MKQKMQRTALVAAALWACAAQAATLTGTVSSGGKPLAGAMVTAIDASQEHRDTVYTDEQGRFALNVDFKGRALLRARMPYFKDDSREVDLGKGNQQQSFELTRHTVAAELSASLGASAQLTKLSWQSADSRAAFISQCNYCHQVGNELTRNPKDEKGWADTVHRMEGYFGMLTNKQAEDITKTLTAGFDNKPVAAVQKHEFAPDLAKAKVKEWVVGDGMSFIHDTDVGEDDELYGADEGHDILWHLDRKTGHIDQFKEPDVDLPEGGIFSGIQLPIGVFTGKHGPHSMAQAKDGKFWFTNALSSSFGSFDPKTHAIKLYPIGFTHLYPHTIRIDKDGIVWFTVVASNEVVRFDPKTEQFKVIQLPRNNIGNYISDWLFPWVVKIASWFPKQNLQLGVAHTKWAFMGREALPFPYGIDVNPVDGSIWYCKLNVNKIGRIDPKTLEIQEFDTPLKGPRRGRFDAKGVFWIPAFDDSGLMAFDTQTHRFETFKLPLLAHNEYEVPYALNVHPKTQQIWITSNMSDRAFRFDPPTKSFVSYPLPTRVTWLRDWAFTKDGAACSSSSNLPSYGIEGGRASFICLYPDGDPADTAALQAAQVAAPKSAKH